jgi:hypothetical protein
MAIYSLARVTASTPANNPAIQLIASATEELRLLELGIFMTTANLLDFGLGRPSSPGSPSGLATVLGEEKDTPVGTAQLCISWSALPGIPANFFRRTAVTNIIGAGLTWTFPFGLRIPAGDSIVLWKFSGPNSTNECYAVVEE